ncbi:TIGR04255 family protein [Ramlibacter sp. AW1]|uniref:TIGR04255 family protein n=2 Tax=Ramlibacter aurantiacus TaxID=2801330 RepID=A0A937D552_9BURK|nr:TIGR04255 family protein [Ramlibacter aurantiacus]
MDEPPGNPGRFIRFTSKVPAATVLPGLFFSKLVGVGQIEPLPAAQLPEQMRALDPQLAFAPLSRIGWKEQFAILVGERSLVVGCRMPYPGWVAFKPAILEVLGVLKEAQIVTRVHRHSLKYIDLLNTGDDDAEALRRLNVSVRVGSHTIASENTALRSELKRGPFLQAVQVASRAVVQQEGVGTRTGALIDVDTLAIAELEPAEFFANLPSSLEDLHTANKQMFFECLTEYGLSLLEPKYD